MFYYLAQYLEKQAADTSWEPVVSPLNVFRYITFRSAAAAMTALLLSLWLGPKMIVWLKQLKFGQQYRDKAEEGGGMAVRLLSKRGTPTMGGILIVLVVDLTALAWAQWNTLILLTILSLIVLAGLGFYDDYMKITHQDNRGTKSHVKLWIQFALALFIGAYLWILPETSKLVTEIHVPFYKYPLPIEGAAAAAAGIAITVLAIVGSSNAVNLTDGLDGLAIGCTLIVTMVFVILTYIAGNAIYSRYLQVPFVPGAGELTVFCAGMIGAGLGFLWFNCHPAQMFMGDTGSLALGGVLGIIAVLIQQPFVLVIAGGVFVAEALSVLLQTAWTQRTRPPSAGQPRRCVPPVSRCGWESGRRLSRRLTRR
jgi:phospho-N-acetylmuramoyl-pentapeptide-transferase